MMARLSRALTTMTFWPLIYLALSGLTLSSCSTAEVPERTTLLNFQHSPFPYPAGTEALGDTPFFDVNDNGRRGHTSRRGGLYWEDITYSDNRVLISIPPSFSWFRPAYLVVFLHGNQATLERDVRDRQQVPAQLAASGLNAILVAPQLAVDALDSSAGRFANPGFFNAFLDEAAEQIGGWRNSKFLARKLKRSKVILVAYSGGYQAAANALRNGDAQERIGGVVLLDALYGQEQTFADFVGQYRSRSFLFSTYTEPAREANEALMALLNAQQLPLDTDIPRRLRPKQLVFLPLGPEVNHVELMANAWTQDPLADLLRRLR